MNKFPFNPAGVAALCHHLYLMDDVALAIEATAIESDFKTWTAKWFDLDEGQLLYLNGLPLAALQFLAFQTSFTIGNRLPVTLIKPEQAGARASKLFEPKASVALTVLPDQSYKASGALVLTISY